MYRTLPTTLSLELRMQRYDNFLNPPNFRRSFFFREPHPCVWHLLYIGVLQSHLRRHLLYIVSVRTWDLDKEADKQRSSRQNLLTTQGSPDTSEDPFFWVASAKVIQLPETTKLSANFFFGGGVEKTGESWRLPVGTHGSCVRCRTILTLQPLTGTATIRQPWLGKFDTSLLQ